MPPRSISIATHKPGVGARVRAWSRVLLGLLIFLAASSQLTAGEIKSFRDGQDRSVYVNAEDRELRRAVDRGGVAAGLRVIDRRKSALPLIEEYIEEVASHYQVDPKLVLAVIEVESAWNPKARSEKGAMGLMQLMPETARRFEVHKPFDPQQNIEGGVRYLRLLLDRFDQNLTFALAAYNAGEAAVEIRGDVPTFRETRNYVERVNMLYARSEQRNLPEVKAVYRMVAGGYTTYTNIY